MSSWSNTDVSTSKPKYLNMNDRNNNNANTYGVSTLEMQQSANANSYSESTQHQGWVKIIPQYTDSSGQIRRKAETLVVIGATITGNSNVRVAGNVSVLNTSANVVGTNTRFTTELKVGDFVTIVGLGEKRVVSITNATFLTVNSNYAAVNANGFMYVSDKAFFPLT